MQFYPYSMLPPFIFLSQILTVMLPNYVQIPRSCVPCCVEWSGRSERLATSSVTWVQTPAAGHPRHCWRWEWLELYLHAPCASAVWCWHTQDWLCVVFLLCRVTVEVTRMFRTDMWRYCRDSASRLSAFGAWRNTCSASGVAVCSWRPHFEF